MSEPTSDELGRGITALMPFIRRWHLPLNPEDAEELVYAVLLHARSDASLDQIVIAVGEQIDQFTQQAQRLTEAMGAALKPPPPGEPDHHG